MGGMPGMGAAAGTQLPKITKKGKAGKQEEQQAPPMKMIKLTKLEQQMYKTLQAMNVPYPLFAQFSVKVPGEDNPFVIDFAYPKVGIGVETDGEIWHQRDDFIQRDKIRDQKLANVGWRILRFREDAIEEHIDTVKDIVHLNLVEASRDLKKRSSDDTLKKYASVDEFISDCDNIGVNIIPLPKDLGYLYLIGKSKENKK